MTIAQIINLTGLLLITVGSISAARATPSPIYNPDGSVSLSGDSDVKSRTLMYRKQKLFPKFLVLVGVGAFLQVVAMFI